MLDIKYIEENPNKVKKACQQKNLNPKVVDNLLHKNKKRIELKQKADAIRREINQNADQIKQDVIKGGKPKPSLIEKGKELKQQLKKIEPEERKVKQKYEDLLLHIPNIPAKDVPVGEDENNNVVLRKEGKVPDFSFEPKPHQDLMRELELLDTERGVKVAGFRGYFLKNEALLLEQAILNFALQLMLDKGFTPMSAPVLVKPEALKGTGYFPWGKEDHYQTQDELVLAGTSEVALTSYHQGETLTEADLPIKLTGLSPCFRREVGSYGQDTKGVIRVHQFSKVEQVVLTVADEEETRRWHDKMLGFSEELLQALGLPYQVLLMCTGDMGAGQRKKYDIETWFPVQKKYRETHSCSYFNDFQTRRLNIRYQAKDGTLKYAYSLNNTVAATPRLLAAVVENYQKPDGSIIVPEVLRKWIKNDKIKKKK